MRSRQNASNSQPRRVGLDFLVELSVLLCGQITCIWLPLIYIGDVNDVGIHGTMAAIAFVSMIYLLTVFPILLLLASIKHLIIKFLRLNGYLAAVGAVMTVTCIGVLLLLARIYYFSSDTTSNRAQGVYAANPNNVGLDVRGLRELYITIIIFFILTSFSLETCNSFLPSLKKSRRLRFCLFLLAFVMALSTLTLMIWLFV